MIGDGITAFDVARTARRKGAKDVVVIAQHEADDIPAGARDLAAALEEGVKVEFGALAKKVKTKGGKAQGVECVRVVREKGRRKEVRGSRFELAATTVVMATGYAPRLGDSADYLPLADSRLIANYYTGRTPEEGVFAAGDAITGSRSVIHAVAERQALGARRRRLAARRGPRGARGAPRRVQRPAVPRPAQGRGAARRARRASRRAQPRVAQDGRERRVGASRHHAQGRQAEAPHGHRPRGREGLQPRRRPRRGHALPAVRVPEQRRLRPADARRRVRDHRQRPRRQGQPGARGRAAVRAPVHPPRHEPLHRLRQVRARVPRRRRPGLLRLHGPGLHHQRRHPLQRRAAARRLHQLRPLRHVVPHRRAHLQRARTRLVQGRREPLHHVPRVRGRVPGGRDQGHQPLRGRAHQVARARGQGQRAGRRSPHVRRLRRADRRAPDPDGHGRPGRRLGGHRLPRGEHHHLPVHLVEGQLHPHRLRELGRDALRRRDRVPRPQEEGPRRGGHQVHRLRRRRRHLRHRPAVALRRHGARPPDAVRLLRQRRLHEHRLPALRRHAAGRLDDHQPGGQGASRARSRTARTSPTS